MSNSAPGIAFEQAVAAIQAQIDPHAAVSHDERLVDRLGQRRQFDVVIRGQFAGQNLLGIIECKDLRKRVGTPDIDAFKTKSEDINANFKIVMSRTGFTRPAIEKAKHYGIQTLSLIPNDEVNTNFKVGNYWFADIYHWEKISITLDFVKPPVRPLIFDVHDLFIRDKPLVDWFTNYLVSHHSEETRVGWIVCLFVDFSTPQPVTVGEHGEHVCKGIYFSAKREVAKKRKFVGINGPGIFDWQDSTARIPSNSTLTSDAVQTDFMNWEDRDSDDTPAAGLVHVNLIGHMRQFEFQNNAIDLEEL